MASASGGRSNHPLPPGHCHHAPAPSRTSAAATSLTEQLRTFRHPLRSYFMNLHRPPDPNHTYFLNADFEFHPSSALSNVCYILCHDLLLVSLCSQILQLLCLYRRAQHSSSHFLERQVRSVSASPIFLVKDNVLTTS